MTLPSDAWFEYKLPSHNVAGSQSLSIRIARPQADGGLHRTCERLPLAASLGLEHYPGAELSLYLVRHPLPILPHRHIQHAELEAVFLHEPTLSELDEVAAVAYGLGGQALLPALVEGAF